LVEKKTLKVRELLEDLGVDGWIIFKPFRTWKHNCAVQDKAKKVTREKRRRRKDGRKRR
jgi:hypothetical protein